MKINEVLLFTAGIDSYILREYLLNIGHKFDCLYFNHKGRYVDWEIKKIKDLNFPVIIDNRLVLSDIERDDAFIPNRNILFTILASSLGYKKIWLGGSLSDRVGDNKSEICEKISNILTEANEEYYKVDSPFYNCYKDDMVRWFVNKFPDKKEDLVKNTFSCFNPMKESKLYSGIIDNQPIEYRTSECMMCSACFRKCAVLFSGGIFIKFREKNIIDKYDKQFRNPIIPDARTKGTIDYIDLLHVNNYGEINATY